MITASPTAPEGDEKPQKIVFQASQIIEGSGFQISIISRKDFDPVMLKKLLHVIKAIRDTFDDNLSA